MRVGMRQLCVRHAGGCEEAATATKTNWVSGAAIITDVAVRCPIVIVGRMSRKDYLGAWSALRTSSAGCIVGRQLHSEIKKSHWAVKLNRSGRMKGAIVRL